MHPSRRAGNRFVGNPPKGFGLVELVLVLGVLALLVVAVFAVFVSVQRKNAVTLETQRLTAVAAVVRQVYGTQRDYSTLTTDVANAARAFPVAMNGGVYTAGAPVRNYWDGAVMVGPLASSPHQFVVRYAGVPSESCAALVIDTEARFSRVQIGATVVKDRAGGFQFDPNQAVAVCAALPALAMEWASY